MKTIASRPLLAVLPLVLGLCQAFAGTATFQSATGITINDSSAPSAASPYPSGITVSGMTGTIHKVTVQLQGLTHTFPSDVDVMLVSPGGLRAVILSDVGSGTDISGVSLTLDDDAVNPLPESTILTSGTYKPTNTLTGDNFPAPAPVSGANVALSTFAGAAPNGTWNLYVVDDVTTDSGSLTGWSLTITTPVSAGELVISEFRVRGPNGANDEFIEIQNATDTDHAVASTDGSTGYAVRPSDGITRFTIPNGTVIPARGHYLGVNSVGYSLAAYPAGNGTTATGDATYTTNIADNAGIALFRTSNPVNFTLANRLDAVGSTSEANTLYKEGTGYPAITPFNIDSSFYRDLLGGVAKDTGNNADDFVFVDTNGTSAGAGQRLGTPGPENLSSPVGLRIGKPLVRNLLDSLIAPGIPPNRVRNFTSDPANNSTFGVIDVRRKFTNQTGGSLSRLRFRVVDLSTFPSPSGIADLRPRTSTPIVVAVTGGNVTVQGTVLEQPPGQPNGGGFNSTLRVGAVTPGAPLASGDSANVRFLFGIQQTGTFKFAMIPETLPASAGGVWIVSGSTENGAIEVETLPAFSIVDIDRLASDVEVDHLCSPGILYRFQRSVDLNSWSDIGTNFPGTGQSQAFLHTGAAGPAKQFYRIRHVP